MHVIGLKALQQAPAHEGAQDAAAQGGLHLGHSGLIDCMGGMKNHLARFGLIIGINLGVAVRRACQLLKHPVDDAHMKMHMFVQASAEAVDKSHCANMHRSLLPSRCMK